MPSEDAFHDRRITALDALLGASAGVEARLHCVLSRHDIFGADFDVLIQLARAPHHALRMRDLAIRSWLSTSGVTRVIDRLEGSELVRRESCPGDRRSLMAVLTDEGREKLHTVLPELFPVIEHCFVPLEATEVDALIDSLQRVRERTMRLDQTSPEHRHDERLGRTERP